MLRYIQNSREENVTDDSTRALHEYVSQVRVQPEVRLEYMKFDEIIAWERHDAAEKATREIAYVTKRNDIFELLEENGEIPNDIRKQIESEESPEVLKEWLKLAAKATSMDDFRKKIADH